MSMCSFTHTRKFQNDNGQFTGKRANNSQNQYLLLSCLVEVCYCRSASNYPFLQQSHLNSASTLTTRWMKLSHSPKLKVTPLLVGYCPSGSVALRQWWEWTSTCSCSPWILHWKNNLHCTKLEATCCLLTFTLWQYTAVSTLLPLFYIHSHWPIKAHLHGHCFCIAALSIWCICVIIF